MRCRQRALAAVTRQVLQRTHDVDEKPTIAAVDTLIAWSVVQGQRSRPDADAEVRELAVAPSHSRSARDRKSRRARAATARTTTVFLGNSEHDSRGELIVSALRQEGEPT